MIPSPVTVPVKTTGSLSQWHWTAGDGRERFIYDRCWGRSVVIVLHIVSLWLKYVPLSHVLSKMITCCPLAGVVLSADGIAASPS